MRRGHAGGAGPTPPTALEEVWEQLRLRAAAHRRALDAAEARDDTAALRALCREGLALIADMEAVAAVACAAHTPAGPQARGSTLSRGASGPDHRIAPAP